MRVEWSLFGRQDDTVKGITVEADLPDDLRPGVTFTCRVVEVRREVIERERRAAKVEAVALIAAVCEAYDNEGVGIWWNSWLRAEPARRARMETGVLAEWSGHVVGTKPTD